MTRCFDNERAVRSTAIGLAAGVLLALSGCAQVMPPNPGPPPLPPLAVPMPAKGAPGSLWRADRAANYAFLDVRPRFPGDLLTVVRLLEYRVLSEHPTLSKAIAALQESNPFR